MNTNSQHLALLAVLKMQLKNKTRKYRINDGWWTGVRGGATARDM